MLLATKWLVENCPRKIKYIHHYLHITGQSCVCVWAGWFVMFCCFWWRAFTQWCDWRRLSVSQWHPTGSLWWGLLVHPMFSCCLTPLRQKMVVSHLGSCSLTKIIPTHAPLILWLLTVSHQQMEFIDLLPVAAINSSRGLLGLLNHVGLQVKAWPTYTDEDHEIWLKVLIWKCFHRVAAQTTMYVHRYVNVPLLMCFRDDEHL